MSNNVFRYTSGFWYLGHLYVPINDDIFHQLPNKFELFQNYPNPFNPVTTIRYALPQKSDVLLEVYNILGQRIVTLVDKSMPAGFHDIQFGNNKLPTGFYIYRIQMNNFHDVKKMVLMK
ncbi:MAG: T9SS type A sorting domain-containing protein [bacterium]|nr:MAG: T9SS type A sorting domain-containing protein [bacterium]